MRSAARVIEKFGLVDLTMFLAKFAATEIKCRQNDNRRVFGGQTDDLDIINNEQRVDRCTFTSQLSEIHYRTKFNTKTFVMPDIFQTEVKNLNISEVLGSNPIKGSDLR